MYHHVVRRRLQRVFDQLNRREFDAMPALFTRNAEHVFGGEHALAGTRRSGETIRRWYARLPQVLPELQFDVAHIVVAGWPWHTVAAVEWRDHGRTLDGEPFDNAGVHFLTLRWGRVSSLRIYCDTQRLATVLQRNAQHGASEAAAAPITG
jgi:ketosteroid isomerase-like protein